MFLGSAIKKERKERMKYGISLLVTILITLTPSVRSATRHGGVIPTVDVSSAHPRLLFSQSDLREIRKRATLPIFKLTAKRLLERAEWQLTAPPTIPSITKAGEPDPPGG